MTFSSDFEIPVGRIDRVRLGPKENFDFRFLRPLEGDYTDIRGNIFSASETFDAGYEPFDEPVCSRVVDYGGELSNTNAVSGEAGSLVDVGTVGLGTGVNVPRDIPLEFHAPDGNVYGVTLQVTRLTAGGTPTLNTAANSFSSTGGHDYRYRLIAGPDVLGAIKEVRWGIRPTSLNGGGETFQVQAGIDSYPTNYIAGTNNNAPQSAWDTQTGIFASGDSFVYTNTNNSSNPSAFEFTGTDVSFRLNSQSGVGAGMTIELLSGPSFDICLCERVDGIEEDIVDTNERIDNLPIQANTATGIFDLGNFEPAAPINIAGQDFTTGLDLTQTSRMKLYSLYSDLGTDRGWSVQINDVDLLIRNAASGDTVDARSGPFDNDFLQYNLIDAALGIFNVTDNGRQFEIERMWLEGPAIPTEVASFAQASLVGQNGNQENAAFDLTTDLVTTGSRWTTNASDFTLSSGASYIEFSAMAGYTYDAGDGNNAALQRVAPILELHKNGVLVAFSGTAYQRHTIGHNEASNTIYHTDLSPAVGDVWELRMTQGSTQNDVMNVTHGQFTAKAVA